MPLNLYGSDREKNFEILAALEEYQGQTPDGHPHGGPCCGSCWAEKEDGHPGVDYCCCNAGDYALENKDYDPVYKPIDGKIPEEVKRYFKPASFYRWINRFKNQLDTEELEQYSCIKQARTTPLGDCNV